MRRRQNIGKSRPWVEELEPRITPADLLPDLHVLLSNWTHDINSQLLRFDTAMANGGHGPMELRGTSTVVPDPEHPGQQLELVNQVIYEGTYPPDATWTDNPRHEVLAGYFEYHAAHGHTHFTGFSQARLLIRGGAGEGTEVASSDKTSFNLLDSFRYNAGLPGSPGSGAYPRPPQEKRQGISVGWYDLYNSGLPDQTIDVTGVPNGDYWLEVEADPDNRIHETNETNNTTRIPVTLGGQPPSNFQVLTSDPQGGTLGPVSSVTLFFNQTVNASSFTTADVSFTGPNGTIAITGITPVSGTQFRVDFAPQTRSGTYLMTVGPSIQNMSSQAMDQDGDGTPGEATDAYFNIFAIPSPRVVAMFPFGQNPAPVGLARLTFNQPMDPDTFTTADVVSFYGPGGAISVTGVTPVGGSGNTQFDLAFAPQTANGIYTLVIGPDIRNPSGDLLDQNGDDVLGQDPVDRFVGTFGINAAGPDAFGYFALPTPPPAVDLVFGGAGVVPLIDNQNDQSLAINLGTNTFRFYGATWTGSQLFVSSNGLITFGGAQISEANNDLGVIPSQPAIAALWHDWTTVGTMDADRVLYKLDDTTGDSVPDRLIIEWNAVENDGGSPPVTFQAILELNTGTRPGNIILNFPDLDAGSAALNNGASATVGIKDAGVQGAFRLLVAQDTGTNPLVQTGQAILIQTMPPSVQSITRLNPSPIGTLHVRFLVQFDKPVTGLDVADFALTASGLADAGIAGIWGGGNSWTVTVSTGTGGPGTLHLDLVDNDTIFDSAGNPLTGGFTAGQDYAIDHSLIELRTNRLNLPWPAPRGIPRAPRPSGAAPASAPDGGMVLLLAHSSGSHSAEPQPIVAPRVLASLQTSEHPGDWMRQVIQVLGKPKRPHTAIDAWFSLAGLELDGLSIR